MAGVPPLDMHGQTLGGYEIVDRLGAGGMGTVYKARDTNLNRFVAIKVLAPVLEADPVCVERFKQEARSIAALRHPNLMHIYSVGSEKSLHYFAMEYIEGKPLSKVLAEKGALSLEEALTVIAQMLSALHKTHGAGIVHRDLKPGNIMIDSDGRVVVLDFGLSKDTTAAMGLTAASTIMGTPDYMAPEQIEGETVGAFTDVYAVGVMLFEMVTCSLPFHRKSAVATMRAHCEEDAPPLTQYRSDLPVSLGAILARMLAKTPKERYQRVSGVAEDLARLFPHPLLVELVGEKVDLTSAPTVMRKNVAATRATTVPQRSAVRKKKTVSRGKPLRSKQGGREAPPSSKASRRQFYIGLALGAFALLVLIGLRRGCRNAPLPAAREPGLSHGVGVPPVDGSATGTPDAPVELPKLYVPEGQTDAPGVQRARVRIVLRNGRVIVGELLEADEVTLKVRMRFSGEEMSIAMTAVRAILPQETVTNAGQSLPAGRLREILRDAPERRGTGRRRINETGN